MRKTSNHHQLTVVRKALSIGHATEVSIKSNKTGFYNSPSHSHGVFVVVVVVVAVVIFQTMHPLVRDLYKRALIVGRDYPLGLEYVRTAWKRAMRNPNNCPSCYQYYCKNGNKVDDGIDIGVIVGVGTEPSQRSSMEPNGKMASKNEFNGGYCGGGSSGGSWKVLPEPFPPACEKELRKAVGRGRFMIREMVGVIQLKKYRAMNQRYGQQQEQPPQQRLLLPQHQQDRDENKPKGGD
jgi:hypothetical protein